MLVEFYQWLRDHQFLNMWRRSAPDGLQGSISLWHNHEIHKQVMVREYQDGGFDAYLKVDGIGYDSTIQAIEKYMKEVQ